MRMVRAVMVVAVLMFSGALAALIAQQPPEGQAAGGGRSGRGWEIPAGAAQEKSPIPETPENLEKGKKVYNSKCKRCHGDTGKGDGPDAEPDESPEDLSDPGRAARNPDGVMFYKVWNGRKSPKMPSFKTEGLTKDDVWLVVQYAKSLRVQK
jgi:mono/diheme cytochrome c family protein